MTDSRHPLEQLQRGIGVAMFILVIAMIVFGYLDTSERSPTLIFGLPALAVLFTTYSIVKLMNARIRIRSLRNRTKEMQNDMIRGLTK